MITVGEMVTELLKQDQEAIVWVRVDGGNVDWAESVHMFGDKEVIIHLKDWGGGDEFD